MEMTLNLDANYTCCMWYILMTTMYISHGKVDMEFKITWVTAEFVNMDLNLTNNDELFTKDRCNGEKNEELKSAFLKHYQDPSLWLITEDSIHHAVDYLKTHNLPYLILKGLVNHSN